jgi:hypothetical protein
VEEAISPIAIEDTQAGLPPRMRASVMSSNKAVIWKICSRTLILGAELDRFIQSAQHAA